MKARQHRPLTKTIGSLFLSSLLVFGLGGIKAQAANVTYTDVTSDYWAYASIADLSQKGIAAGANNYFYPETNVTRAQFVKLLVKSLNLPLTTNTTSSFADVPASQWYFPYVQTAFQANIAHGVSSTDFAPDDPISRQDMIVMLVNALHLQSVPAELLGAMLPFGDAGAIRSNARSAVALGKELQLVSGTPDGNFQPTAATSRAQASVVLDKMLYLPSDRLQAMTADSFHPTTHLAVQLAANQTLTTGYPAQLQLRLVDGNNQPVQLTTPVTVTLSVSDPNKGNVSTQPVVITAGGIATTNFNAGFQPGDVTVTATPAAASLATTLSGSTKLTVSGQSPTALVSGKGAWLMWSDWHNNNTDQLIAKAKASGISHLYIEVATSWQGQGFYGPDALDDLLPKAHAAGIKVIGWVYASLQNPTNDASVDLAVAKYRTPSGDMVDGLSPDIEETANINVNSVTTYSSALRNTLGQSYPLILCTFPSTWRPNYPWTTFANYYDVIAPMDYWHYHDRTYSYADAFSEISNTVKQLRVATGKPYLPISVIGEGYDMFDDNGANSPSGDEIRGSIGGAKAAGAIGYSIYRWGTMTADEWDAFSSYGWW